MVDSAINLQVARSDDKPYTAGMTKFFPYVFSEPELSRLLAMAVEDRTTFEAIQHTFGLSN